MQTHSRSSRKQNLLGCLLPGLKEKSAYFSLAAETYIEIR